MARTAIAPESPHGKSVKLRRGTGNRNHPNPKDDAAAAARKERQDRVSELRIKHSLTWAEIGRQVGVGEDQAHNDFRAWMARTDDPEKQNEVKREEEGKLAALEHENGIARAILFRDMTKTEKLSEKIAIGGAIALLEGKAAKISESRRKLHGVDVERQEHTGPNGGPIQVATSGATLSELLAIAAKNRES